jgi:hypothetical protein
VPTQYHRSDFAGSTVGVLPGQFLSPAGVYYGSGSLCVGSEQPSWASAYGGSAYCDPGSFRTIGGERGTTVNGVTYISYCLVTNVALPSFDPRTQHISSLFARLYAGSGGLSDGNTIGFALIGGSRNVNAGLTVPTSYVSGPGSYTVLGSQFYAAGTPAGTYYDIPLSTGPICFVDDATLAPYLWLLLYAANVQPSSDFTPNGVNGTFFLNVTYAAGGSLC